MSGRGASAEQSSHPGTKALVGDADGSERHRNEGVSGLRLRRAIRLRTIAREHPLPENAPSTKTRAVQTPDR